MKKTKKTKTNLILDMSPILYGNLFSATNYAKSNKLPKENDKYIFKEYKDVVIQKIIEEISGYRNKFNLTENDDLILAFDTSTKEGYWRRDIWAGYKSKRKQTRDDSNIQWDKAFETFEELKDKFNKCSNAKVISVPRTEGDDIIFVLSEYLSNKDENVIIFSSDHDFFQCISENVKFWRTTRSQGMESSDYCVITEDERKDEIKRHIIEGDPGDGFGHIKQYSQFSDDFIKIYPHLKGKELQAYNKRFQIEEMFKRKYGEDKKAYKHPRFGYKSFKKSKKTLKDLLKENKIYKMNYEMNKILALPENIPDKYKQSIIEQYENKNECDYSCFVEYLMNNRLFKLTSLVYMI